MLNGANPSRNKLRRRQNKSEWDDAYDVHDVHDCQCCRGVLMSLMPCQGYVNDINALPCIFIMNYDF